MKTPKVVSFSCLSVAMIALLGHNSTPEAAKPRKSFDPAVLDATAQVVGTWAGFEFGSSFGAVRTNTFALPVVLITDPVYGTFPLRASNDSLEGIESILFYESGDCSGAPLVPQGNRPYAATVVLGPMRTVFAPDPTSPLLDDVVIHSEVNTMSGSLCEQFAPRTRPGLVYAIPVVDLHGLFSPPFRVSGGRALE